MEKREEVIKNLEDAYKIKKSKGNEQGIRYSEKYYTPYIHDNIVKLSEQICDTTITEIPEYFLGNALLKYRVYMRIIPASEDNPVTLGGAIQAKGDAISKIIAASQAEYYESIGSIDLNMPISNIYMSNGTLTAVCKRTNTKKESILTVRDFLNALQKAEILGVSADAEIGWLVAACNNATVTIEKQVSDDLVDKIDSIIARLQEVRAELANLGTDTDGIEQDVDAVLGTVYGLKKGK